MLPSSFPTAEEYEEKMKNRFQVKTKVSFDGKHYVISTVELVFSSMSAPFETMAFECDAEGEVTNWSELYCDTYDSQEEALKGHEFAVTTFRP